MEHYKQKLEYLKWLKTMGVDFFFTNSSNFDADLLEAINAIPEKIKPILLEVKEQEKHNLVPVADVLNGTIAAQDVAKARELASNCKTLDELREVVRNFNGCDLKKFATNTVFADGNPEAQILLIGEAPGATEDLQGIPFCGESGMLLDKMLASIGLSRDKNVYITNTVFWRPPANRRPTQEEIDICRPFVERHIALINPKLIILVGSTAATSLLGKHEGISNIRSNAFNYKNCYLSHHIHMTAIFHPAYLLRQPMQKKTTWFDLIKIQQFIIENCIKL